MTKILLVEDDKSLREIYGVRLLAEGYDIVSAGDGEEALAVAIKERPDLILSDVMMPKISGFDMLDILRSTTETKNIRVIMMTALSSEDQRQRGVALGADRYLVKSQVGIEDVVRVVHEVLADDASQTPQQNTPQPTDNSLTDAQNNTPQIATQFNTIPEQNVSRQAPQTFSNGPTETPRSSMQSRIIQPLRDIDNTEKDNLGDLMNKELEITNQIPINTPQPTMQSSPDPRLNVVNQQATFSNTPQLQPTQIVQPQMQVTPQIQQPTSPQPQQIQTAQPQPQIIDSSTESRQIQAVPQNTNTATQINQQQNPTIRSIPIQNQ